MIIWIFSRVFFFFVNLILNAKFSSLNHTMVRISKMDLNETRQYGKDFMRLEFPPSYSNFPMYHRNDKLLTVRIILIYLFICKQYM